jgi:RND family efflux transporter MFP subunit
LDQARATLASAVAKADFSERQYKRYSDLARTDSTSRQQAEQTHSDRDADDAAVMQAQASLAQAQITYGYTHVTAPFDGIVTAHQANVGELVGGSQATLLATIVQLDPIWVNFNIAEQDVLRIRGSTAASGVPSHDLHNAAVEIGLQDEAGYPHRGHIDYVAPQLDSATGTLAARGLFDNPAHVLLPGYFVRIRIPVGSLKGALLVPDDAVGNDQGGRNLLVVTPTNVVEARTVTLGTHDGDLRIIISGLKPDDRVIVDGLQRVRIGQKVVPHEVTSTAAPNKGEDKP